MENFPKRARDIRGQVRGKLTVLEYVGKNDKNAVLWSCQCECGRYVTKDSIYLSSPNNMSCGCYDGRAIAVFRKNVAHRLSMVGMKFGRLTITAVAEVVNRRSHYHCTCDCGKCCTVNGTLLSSGGVKSCGCLVIESRKTHGLSNHTMYSVWEAMIQRCHNPNNPRYHRYGGRGIKVCDRWRKDFLVFYNWAMMNGYQRGLTIERLDNDLGYDPGNCCWTTNQVQARNKSNVILTQADANKIREDGRTGPIVAAEYGISVDHVYRIRSGRYWKDIDNSFLSDEGK